MIDRVKRLILVALVTLPAAAFTLGGWAVVTVEDMPEYAVAGTSFDLTYTVRQHGLGLFDRLRGEAVFSLAGNRVVARATGLGEGMYRARVTIPSAGVWTAKIDDGFSSYFGGHLLPLRVVAASAPAPAPLSGYDRGHQLYLAKGCVSCHSMQSAKEIPSTNIGADLGIPKFTAAYLARFLADPSVKKDWRTANRMPNLGLKPAEITALTAFLNQERGSGSR